jgi:hypothetical protein
MEKTWEIREKEIREEIAYIISSQVEAMMPPVDEIEHAVYTALNWATDVALGKQK